LFLRQLRKGDWIALVAYDLKPRVEVDFTQNPDEIVGGLRRLTYPGGFREHNMFDALADTLDRMKDIEGKKSIIVVGSGMNSFSRLTWDDMQKLAREHRTVIYGIGMGWPILLLLERAEDLGYPGHVVAPLRSDLQIAEVQLKALSEKTGGRAYFPRFISQMPAIYEEIGAMLRNQYSVAFRPRELKRDGKFHKIQIKLVGPDGTPLKVIDQKGKEVKYQIYAREGYYAPQA
jgi:VWFA-related protein